MRMRRLSTATAALDADDRGGRSGSEQERPLQSPARPPAPARRARW
ncbi:hypothetical protein THAOC_12059, partial [Thalassiosira oceanica]